MTERHDHDLTDPDDARRASSVPVPDPTSSTGATPPTGPPSDVRPEAPTPFGTNVPVRGDDPYGSRAHGLTTGAQYRVPPRTGGPEETTITVPPLGEGTGPTTALSPDHGGRQTPPPPTPGPPQYGQPTHQIAPDMGARTQQRRGPDGMAERGGPPRPWDVPPPGAPQQRSGPPPPPGQRPGPPPGRPSPNGQPPQGSWGETSGPYPTSGGWTGDAYRSGAAPTNFNYTDSIRSSDLVPTRKLPPRHGWRKGVLVMTFGLLNLGRSPDERLQDELVAKTRTLLRGRYKIGVLGKGGTGKTTLAASLGSILAELRQDDRVVAIDADTAFGKLGSRIDPHASGSYWELAADQHLNSFADVRSRVGSNAAGLFVLAGEHNTARRRVLDPAIYREAAARLDNHFTITIVDCGSTMDSPVTQEALADLDALLVVSSPWVDGASAAGQTMEWLAHNGYTGLLHRTVVVLNDSDGHADKRTRKLLVEQFGARGQVVVEVPFDAHLRPGGVIDVDTEIGRTTRRRILEIAATVAEHFAATTDGPRERR